MSSILVIEDDPAVARGLADNLEFEGLDVRVAGTGEDGLAALRAAPADLLLLDLMLPGMNGFDVLRALAEHAVRPRTIVVSARDAEADVVRALDLGAHDYVKKPFGLSELLARVRAQLREAGGGGAVDAADDLVFHDVWVALRRFRLWKGEREHLLSHLEVGMLRLFAARVDEPISRGDILREAWGEDAYPSERTVDNFVVKLRKKIEDDPKQPRFLRTVHGHGYRFTPDGADGGAA